MDKLSATDSDPGRLVSTLRAIGNRNRTGIILVPASWLGREDEIAVRLGVGHVDSRAWVLSHLAAGQRYLGANWRSLIGRELHQMVSAGGQVGGCLMVGNFDLFISALPTSERDALWRHLRSVERPPYGLILALPSQTSRLIEPTERDRWQAAGRFAIWTEE
jgi:hypothetical protein